jgi:hypothetical protein
VLPVFATGGGAQTAGARLDVRRRKRPGGKTRGEATACGGGGGGGGELTLQQPPWAEGPDYKSMSRAHVLIELKGDFDILMYH